VDDAADHAPIVDARLAAGVGRQMRLDFRKLYIRQPELIPIHRRFLSEAVNHNPLLMPMLLWVRTLGEIAARTNRVQTASRPLRIGVADLRRTILSSNFHRIDILKNV
jgi:hypothetical protein